MPCGRDAGHGCACQSHQAPQATAAVAAPAPIACHRPAAIVLGHQRDAHAGLAQDLVELLAEVGRAVATGDPPVDVDEPPGVPPPGFGGVGAFGRAGAALAGPSAVPSA